MHKRYIIFCDESEDKGQFYSNFYGGALIEASMQQSLHNEIQQCKDALNIFSGEMKWERITEPYAGKYIIFVNKIFDIMERGDMKMRIMFTQNMYIPRLKEYQIGNDYFMLYYQFIKHAFGLQFAAPKGGSASAALLLDDVPHNEEKFRDFKDYMSSLSAFPVWRRAGFSIAREDITDVNSKQHNVLQALDVILGGIQSRLNEKHTRPHPPAKRRSKRARAKARVYDTIKARIQQIYPGFNVGISTGAANGQHMRFEHAYRHWLFIPNDADVDFGRTKRASKVK